MEVRLTLAWLATASTVSPSRPRSASTSRAASRMPRAAGGSASVGFSMESPPASETGTDFFGRPRGAGPALVAAPGGHALVVRSHRPPIFVC